MRERDVIPEDHQPHLTLLDAAELADDRHPDEPFRLLFPGYWRRTGNGCYERADIGVRLSSADLAALLAQIRAQQLKHASRIRGMSLAELEAERARAAELAVRYEGPPPETALLELVLVKLRAA